MEQVSYPDFLCKNYIDIKHECPPWSTRHPPPNAAAAALLPSPFLVKFTFSCESHYMEWVESEDSQPHVLRQYSHPEADKSIALTLEQLLENHTETMAWELRELPLTVSQCARLILYALEQAQRDVVWVPPYDNVLNLHLRVDVMHKHRMCGARDSVMSRVMQESFHAATVTVTVTVPATEAMVDMVMREKVELNGMETCTICLEEVGEAVQMPCSHVFHGDCIREWLRIDYRCPLCRFEIPMVEM